MEDLIRGTKSSGIQRLLRLTIEKPQAWTRSELRDLLAHQLETPLGCDRALTGPILDHASRSGINSFGDVFRRDDPPVELLRWIKDFAKSSDHGIAALPDEISTVLYLAAILTARQKCGQSISTLSRDDLATGVRWAMKQEWIHPDLSALFHNAVQAELNQNSKS